jgi:hypothetical protein
MRDRAGERPGRVIEIEARILGGGRAMAELILTRVADDGRQFELPGFGSLERTGIWLWRAPAIARTENDQWMLSRRRPCTGDRVAVDSLGVVVGEFSAHYLSAPHSTLLRWAGQNYEFRRKRQPADDPWPTGRFYALDALNGADGELADFAARSGRTPVRVRVEASPSVEAGLMLFATYIAWTLPVVPESHGDGGMAGVP